MKTPILTIFKSIFVSALILFGSSCDTKFQKAKQTPQPPPETNTESEPPQEISQPTELSQTYIFEHINQKMYEEILDPIAFEKLKLDPIDVQTFGPLTVVASRKGKKWVALEFYLPLIPNLIGTQDGFSIQLDPVTNIQGQKIQYTMPTPSFSVRKEGDFSYLYAITHFRYEGKPIDKIRSHISIKLPLNMRIVAIQNNEIKKQYGEFREVIKEVITEPLSLDFIHEGSSANLLGLTAFDSNEIELPLKQLTIMPLRSLASRHVYTWEKPYKRADIYIAESFLTKSYAATIDLNRTYIEAGGHYFTFTPHPHQYFKKSIDKVHEIETGRYVVEIKSDQLTINNLSFGKIAKHDWIHIEDKKVFKNGKLLN